MPGNTRQRNLSDRLIFLREFLRNPRQIGSIIPSSPFLERRLVRMADLATARTVVELGSGTGGTTRALLAAMPENAKLLCLEINPRFQRELEAIGDPRVIVDGAGAQTLSEALAKHSLPAPDVIVSGIPFSTMDPKTGTSIVQSISEALPPGGRFVAYQLRDQVKQLSNPIMGDAQVQMEFRNIPPMRLYRWEKAPAAQAAMVAENEIQPASH